MSPFSPLTVPATSESPSVYSTIKLPSESIVTFLTPIPCSPVVRPASIFLPLVKVTIKCPLLVPSESILTL